MKTLVNLWIRKMDIKGVTGITVVHLVQQGRKKWEARS